MDQEQQARAAADAEVNELLEQVRPLLDGHPRGIILLMCLRLAAVMLGPAGAPTRAKVLDELAPTVRAMLVEIDRQHAAAGGGR